MRGTLSRISQDAAEQARDGKRVALIADTLTEASQHFHDLVETLDRDDVQKIRRTHGQQGVTFRTGGSLIFHSLRQADHAGLRGRTFDRAYVPANIGHKAMTELAPCLNASQDGSIIGYFPE